jgi:hypothetical protein
LKLKILQKAVNFRSKQKLNKMSWVQKSNYFSLNNRIDFLYLQFYFLSLREKIKKEVQNNYTFKTKQQILESIVEYDGYDSIDFENTFIWKKDLEPLIENYIQQQINKIESNTLELAL